eukprot:9494697-Pyramimonas_sp.AAC.1
MGRRTSTHSTTAARATTGANQARLTSSTLASRTRCTRPVRMSGSVEAKHSLEPPAAAASQAATVPKGAGEDKGEKGRPA